MTKYSYEQMLEVVKAYLNGEGGYRCLAQQFNIKCSSDIEEWVEVYREFGEEGLHRKRDNANYTFEFKRSMVESYLSREISCQALALQVGITNPAIISKWAYQRITTNTTELTTTKQTITDNSK